MVSAANQSSTNSTAFKAATTHEMLRRYRVRSIATEVSIPTRNSRADLVFFAKFTYGVEIKSPLDTVRRLRSQLEACSAVFDFAIVVCGESKVGVIESCTPQNSGIWVLTNGGMRVFRRPSRNTNCDLSALHQMLSLNELERLARKHGLKSSSRNRDDLFRQISDQLGSQTRRALVAQLEERYVRSTQRFMAAVGEDEVRSHHIDELNRNAIKKRVISSLLAEQANFWKTWGDTVRANAQAQID